MNWQTYLFVTYVFVLLCLLVLLCNQLFADLKRQKKLLDDKESKLLKLYSGLESTMDEFHDTVTAARLEWDNRYAQLQELVKETVATVKDPLANRGSLASSVPSPQPMHQPNSVPQPVLLTASEQRPVQVVGQTDEVLQPTSSPKPIDFQLLFERAAVDAEAADAEPAPRELHPNRGPTRYDNILTLYSQGKSRPQIAKDLGITQNEVDLVIGIERK